MIRLILVNGSLSCRKISPDVGVGADVSIDDILVLEVASVDVEVGLRRRPLHAGGGALAGQPLGERDKIGSEDRQLAGTAHRDADRCRLPRVAAVLMQRMKDRIGPESGRQALVHRIGSKREEHRTDQRPQVAVVVRQRMCVYGGKNEM